MKNIIYSVFIISTFSISAQNGGTYYTQTEWMEKAKNFETASDSLNCMAAYYYAYIEDPDTHTGKTALEKSGAISTLVQNKIIQDLQGRWILKSSGSNWGFTDVNNVDNETILTIEGNIATFSLKEIKSGAIKNLQVQKLNFIKPFGEYYNYTHILNFLYDDDTIWRFSPSANTLHIIHIGELKNNFFGEIVCGNSEYYYTKIN